MNKKRIFFWGIVLLIGLMLTSCAGYYGGYGYNDYPYNNYDYGYYGYPYYYGQGWDAHPHHHHH